MRRLSERFYRILLLFYPEPYRRAHSDELIRFLRDKVVDKSDAPWFTRTLMWVRVTLDAVTEGISERIYRTRNRVVQPRDRWRGAWFFDLAADTRYAFRAIGRAPGFAVAMILTLGLGIGANSAIFAVVDASLLEPLPYADPDRLVDLNQAMDNFAIPSLPVADARTWAEQDELFASLSLHTRSSFVRTDGDEPVTVHVGAVGANILETLGQSVTLGRGFLESDGVPGAQPVLILLDETWRIRFGADPSIVGKEVVLDDDSYVIVGVLPRGVKFPRFGKLWGWVPLAEDGTVAGEATGRLSVIGRLHDGIDIETAQARADVISAGLAETGSQLKVKLRRHSGTRVNPDVRRALYFLSVAVVLLLSIALANGISLLLSRGVAQNREIMVRAALGASRGRIVRQMLSESFVLSVLSSVFAVGLAFYGLKIIVAMLPSELAFFSATPVELDARVGWFVFGLTMVVGFGLGALPAFSLTRFTAKTGLSVSRYHNPSAGKRNLRAALVVMEVGTATTLWIGCGLLITSFAKLVSVDPGFETRDLTFFNFQLSDTRYPDSNSRYSFMSELAERIAAVSGVETVAMAGGLPPEVAFSFNLGLQAEGSDELTDQPFLFPWTLVGEGFFETMGIPIVRGRGFGPADSSSTIIDVDLAHALWGEVDPIGRRFRLDEDGRWRTVVGVVGDVKLMGQDDRNGAYEMYSPQTPASVSAYTDLAIRSALPFASLVPQVKAIVAEMDPVQPVNRIETAAAAMAGAVDKPRFLVILMTVFAGVALALTAVGIYGVLSFSVSQRRQEIGVRMALGARAASVLGLIVRDGMLLTSVGVVIGIAGGLVGTRLIESLLFGVSAHDPVNIVASALLLLVTALAACYLPARRAALVNPVEVLKAE